MSQGTPNLTHIQLNGNNQLGNGIGISGISVKPIVLGNRANSTNLPSVRLTAKQQAINTNVALTNPNQSSERNLSPTAPLKGRLSLKELNSLVGVKKFIPPHASKSFSASRKISSNFSTRKILNADTKYDGLESRKVLKAHTLSSSGHRSDISLDESPPSACQEITTPSNKTHLPPIKETIAMKAITNAVGNFQENPKDKGVAGVDGAYILNFRSKENQPVKKRTFDFLERTKVKDQSDSVDLQKLQLFFRCKASGLISGTGKKQYYLQFLKNMKDLAMRVKNYEKIAKQVQNQSEVMNKLKKIVATRAKYKYREKIDFERSIIMRTLGYESREIIQKIKENMALEDQEYNDLEDEGDREQEEADKKKAENEKGEKRKELISPEIIANWKKMRGYDPDTKIFILIGLYSELKNGLKEEGWIENPNPESLIFDLKWTTKKKDIDKELLLDQQITNHFEKNHNLTSKSGIALNLRNLIWYNNIDIDTFYPRCYDLSDVSDFEDFIEEFKFTQAQTILKRYKQASQNSILTYSDEKQETYARFQILLACAALKRKVAPLEQKLALINKNILPVVSPEEWNILYKNDQNSEQSYQLSEGLKSKITEELGPEDSNEPELTKLCDKYLILSKEYDPQYYLNQKNSWIVKPAGLSRGRGIRAFDQLEPLINYIVGKDVMWVAQKYMENPMTINKKKFDIRQWVLVTDWNPLTIYFYDTCYIRICFEEYNPQDLHNKFAHLANNCISKHAENFEEKVNDTMMYLEDFVQYIKDKENGQDMFSEKIKKAMMEIVINSIKSCKDSVEHRKNSFEIYGYDFMIDDQYNTWLIEINSSPSMEYSTPVTTKLVKMCLQDTAKFIQDHYAEEDKRFKKEQEFGLWKNIFRETK